MQFIWQHSKDILAAYKGEEPLHLFLKAYYKQHPKLGSRDRKMLSEMAYSWYRCSKGINDEVSFEDKVANCLALCKTENRHLKRLIEPFASDKIDLNRESLFPFDIDISDGISKDSWLDSMLNQPKLFLRIRKDKDKVAAVLEEESTPHEWINDDCLALPNGTPVHDWFPDYVYVVQDASSQQTGKHFTTQAHEHWWDSCAGAGGKSLQLKDIEPLTDLTVSDTRKTILENLKERFRIYSHIVPETIKVNVANENALEQTLKDKKFDNIICDVPCTGSGTWARTPEQLYYFNPNALLEFTERQKNIAVNTAKYLKPNGKLYYITCSIFREENEAVAEHIDQHTSLVKETSKLINGIDIMADSMYISIFRKEG